MGRLRQCVKLARMKARRNEKVARSLGRGGRQNGRLELAEPLLPHPPPYRFDDSASPDDIGVHALATKIEKAIRKPDFFGIFLVTKHRQGQLARFRQHCNAGRIDLHQAGWKFGIFAAMRPDAKLAVNAHHPLGAKRLGYPKGSDVGINNNLRQSVVIAQIDEQQAAVVADPMHPARQTNFLANLFRAQLAAIVAPVRVHSVDPDGLKIERRRRRTEKDGCQDFGLTGMELSSPHVTCRRGLPGCWLGIGATVHKLFPTPVPSYTGLRRYRSMPWSRLMPMTERMIVASSVVFFPRRRGWAADSCGPIRPVRWSGFYGYLAAALRGLAVRLAAGTGPTRRNVDRGHRLR